MEEALAQPLIKRSARKAPRAQRVRRWVKRVVLIVLALGLVGLIGMAWMPKPTPVEMAHVGRTEMVVTVDNDGRTRIIDRYVVAAPLGGRLARIELRPGDVVKEGDVLARISSVEPALLDSRSRQSGEARVAAALAAKRRTLAQITRAKATVRYADSQVERFRALVSAGAASRGELDRMELEASTAAAELSSLKFGAQVATYEHQMAKAALDRMSGKADASEQLAVTAPVSGRILNVMQRSEGVVAAGAPLLEIGDPTALEVIVDVLTRDAVRIAPGAPVSVDRWGGDALPGRVRLVEPSAFTRLSALGVEEQRVNVVIDLESPPANLGDGYRVEAHIQVWQSEDAIVVPTSATFRHMAGWAVFAVRDGKAQRVPVTIGERAGGIVQVTEGLEPPVRVILHPSDKITDGIEVRDRNAT